MSMVEVTGVVIAEATPTETIVHVHGNLHRVPSDNGIVYEQDGRVFMLASWAAKWGAELASEELAT